MGFVRTRTSDNPFNAGADPTLSPTKPRARLNRKWDQKLKPQGKSISLITPVSKIKVIPCKNRK